MKFSHKLAATVATGLFMSAGFAGVAEAKPGDVTVRGTCSAAQVSKLKLAPRATDGTTQVEWSVDQAPVASVWRMVIKDHGVIVVAGRKTATAAGNVKTTAALPGTTGHVVHATARNIVTGATCFADAKN